MIPLLMPAQRDTGFDIPAAQDCSLGAHDWKLACETHTCWVCDFLAPREFGRAPSLASCEFSQEELVG